LPAPNNMNELFNKKCVACEGSTLPFDITEIHKYLKKVDGWDVKKNRDDSHFLEKKFKFNNFLDSQRFINFVSEISENEGHHPDISFGWGYANIKIYTHAIKGLAENDFILAAKIDRI
jgi:4a-hydroxytetrahydrobiopterin dehydratase